jgi:hypothetical protein
VGCANANHEPRLSRVWSRYPLQQQTTICGRQRLWMDRTCLVHCATCLGLQNGPCPLTSESSLWGCSCLTVVGPRKGAVPRLHKPWIWHFRPFALNVLPARSDMHPCQGNIGQRDQPVRFVYPTHLNFAGFPPMALRPRGSQAVKT